MKFLVAILAALVLNTSCRKGADDPAITFHSRDTRLVGTWQLTGFTSKTNTTTKTVTTNEVNTDNSQKSDYSKNERTLSGGTLSVLNYSTSESTSKFDTSSNVSNTGSKSTRSYAITACSVTINDDFTYGLSIEYSVTSGENCKLEKSGSNWSETNCNDLPEESMTKSQFSVDFAGHWNWSKETDDKIAVVFTPQNTSIDPLPYGISLTDIQKDFPISTVFSGYITRLSNKELTFVNTIDESNSSTSYSPMLPPTTPITFNTTAITSSTTREYSETWEKTK